MADGTGQMVDVVVIGGGPAGSTVSTLLAQQAWFLGDPELSWAWRQRGLGFTESDPNGPWRFAILATVVSQCALEDDPERAAPYLAEAERFTGTPTTEALIRFYNYRGLLERGGRSGVLPIPLLADSPRCAPPWRSCCAAPSDPR